MKRTKRMSFNNLVGFVVVLLISGINFYTECSAQTINPVRVETIKPIAIQSFGGNGRARQIKFETNPRTVNEKFVFDGDPRGDRQVDPQIAIGGGYVFHATNSGLFVFDKKGKLLSGVHQNSFNGGIDPKLFYNAHHRVFGFDLWNPWDKEKKKPVNIAVSKSNNPLKGWSIYPVPAPKGVDGGAIGYSKKWIGYSFPGGPEQTFVMKMADAKNGKPAKIYHFPGNLGHPVFTQDATDALYFLSLSRRRVTIRKVFSKNGKPVAKTVASVDHGLKHFSWPPQSPQKDSDKKVASGDRNPKNVVLQGKHLWFSQTVNVDGRAAVAWHQLSLKGKFVQSGLITDPKNSFIQTSIAVNKKLDVLVGFQEAGPDMFVSPRYRFRRKDDKKGTLRPKVSIGEGKAATAGGPWGDYSGSVADGDNQLDLWTIQSVAGKDGKGDTVISVLKKK